MLSGQSMLAPVSEPAAAFSHSRLCGRDVIFTIKCAAFLDSSMRHTPGVRNRSTFTLIVMRPTTFAVKPFAQLSLLLLLQLPFIEANGVWLVCGCSNDRRC